LNAKAFLPGFGEVREEVENSLCNSHVLPAVVLWEEGLSTNQGHPKDVSDILPAHAAKSLNHNESVINSAKPSIPKGGVQVEVCRLIGCKWNGLEKESCGHGKFVLEGREKISSRRVVKEL
jgi:hypothetical protein